MTAPISTQLWKREILKGPPSGVGYRPDWIYRERWWHRQRRPYNLPLPYTFADYRVTSFSGGDAYDYADCYHTGVSGIAPGPQEAAYNMAYARFKAKLGQSAELSVGLAERRQAMDMITKRASQLYQFTRSLKRLDFAGAIHALGMSKAAMPKGLKRNAKAFGNNYLEFHFGWSPLVKDIGNAVEVLQGGVPPMYVRTRGRSPIARWGNSYSTTYVWTDSFKQQCVCQLGAYISVTNPNLWLANQLGFVNPATVAWELVPFSFVVDWFVNVSDFLSGFSDFWGLSLTLPRTTYMQIHDKSEFYAPRNIRTTWKAVHVTRGTSLGTGPTLRIRQPWTVSPRRGLAAISLLLQHMR